MERAALTPLAALAIAALAPQAQAQSSVGDYQLPPGEPSPATRVQGPVDPEHPVLVPRTPAPAAAASAPAPIRAPAPAPGAARAASPSASASPTTAAPAAIARAGRSTGTGSPSAPPVGTTSAEPGPTAYSTAPAPAAPSPALATAAEPAAAASPPRRLHLPWPWPSIAAGCVAAILIALIGTNAVRRRAAAQEPEVEPQPEPELVPAAPPVFAPAPGAPVEPPGPAAQAASLDLTLEARTLSLSLVYATFAYRLTLRNGDGAMIGPLRISGDLASAHASFSAEEQLVPQGAALAVLHELAALQPDEAASAAGELRLALGAIRPVRTGTANLFVPLARFRVEDFGSGEAFTAVFAIGQDGAGGEGALRPISLDLGARTIRDLGQRAVQAREPAPHRRLAKAG